ncbi:MAG TPA: leucine-rich repeat protein [Caproiciproducens sp.]|nr:leucine-rich repeat protein [Caproiciproducens sp.]
MKNITQKALSLLLSLAMLFGMVQGTGFAAASAQTTGPAGVTAYYCDSGLFSDSGYTQGIGDSADLLREAITNIKIKDDTKTICNDAFSGCSRVTDIRIPGSVQYIGNDAFNGCDSLQSILIPASVSSIDEEAFERCAKLTKIDVDQKNTAFTSQDGVLYNHNKTTLICCPGGKAGTFSVPDGVTDISDEAFSYCNNLTRIEIPASVTSIGAQAFDSCHLSSIALTSASLSAANNAISNCSVDNLYIVGVPDPDAIPTVANTFLFEENGNGGYKLMSYTGTKAGIQIPTSLYGKEISPAIDPASLKKTEITAYYDGTNLYQDGSYADSGIIDSNDSYRSLITKINIKGGVTAIGDYAFEGCTSLTDFSIPDSIQSVEKGAFSGCCNLKTVTIGKGSTLQSLPTTAFYGCTALTEIDVEDGNPNFSSKDGVLYSEDRKSLLCFPTGVKGAFPIPEGVTSIGNHAFAGCTGLTSMTIPNSVQAIGDSAFSDCTGLTSVTIPNSVQAIGPGAFSDCTGLTSVIIPDKVTFIGESAFSDCFALTCVILKGEVTSIGKNAFDSDINTTITFIVPASSVTYYQGKLGATVMGTSKAVIVTERCVTAISGLPAAKTVAVGTALKDLNLPSSLSATIGGQTENVDVTWASSPEYNPDQAGTYTFTPVLPITEGFLLADGVSAAVPVTVRALPTVSGVTVSPSAASVQRGASLAFSAVVGGTNNPDQAVTWSVTGNQSKNTGIDQNGKLTVAVDETAATLTVKAVSVSDTGKYGTAIVTVTGSNNGGGSDNHHSSSPTVSAPSQPSSVATSPTGAQADLSGATLPSGVTGVSLAVTPEISSGAPVGTTGGAADPQGATAYHFAVTDNALNIIGTPLLYNIKLLDNSGDPVSFTGRVTVRIPLPVGLRGTPHVFRYEESTGTFTDLDATVQDGYLVFSTTHFSYYVIAGTGDSISLDTKNYQLPVGGSYQIGVKLTGSKAASVKVYSTNGKIASATRLKNGNYQVTGKGVGTAWIMFDVYDNKNHLLTHASVKIDVKTGIRTRGDSTRQIGVF